MGEMWVASDAAGFYVSRGHRHCWAGRQKHLSASRVLRQGIDSMDRPLVMLSQRRLQCYETLLQTFCLLLFSHLVSFLVDKNLFSFLKLYKTYYTTKPLPLFAVSQVPLFLSPVSAHSPNARSSSTADPVNRFFLWFDYESSELLF
jgi:hypothetical protein